MIYTSTLELSELISLSSHTLEITSKRNISVELSLVISSKAGIPSLIQTLDYISTPIVQLYSVLDKLQYSRLGEEVTVLLLTESMLDYSESF